jgi:hypothetical protein
MTYIEFFDKASSENICACLTYAPERVIYVGDNRDLMDRYIARYERVFSDRDQTIAFSCRSVSKGDLTAIIALLTELVETYDDCVFDVTGGDELMLLALGIVHARYPQRNLQIHRFNLRNNAIYDCDKDGNTIFREMPGLSVEENIRIYGGDVIYGDVDGEDTYRWDLTEEFRRDAEAIWSVCKGSPQLWNAQIGVLSALEEVGKRSEDGLTVSASMGAVKHALSRNKASYTHAKGMIGALVEKGLLTGFEASKNLTVSYKNKQVKRCLTKAGQALEMKIFLAAMATEAKGVPVYQDVCNGVKIDWDGKFHDEDTENIYDTENEIDILMMHNMVPVFVSCKNGFVDANELYKLNTVAQRFGGQYAKKILVATSIPKNSEAAKYLRQRARDMKIHLLEGVQKMDDKTLQNKLENLWKI